MDFFNTSCEISRSIIQVLNKGKQWCAAQLQWHHHSPAFNSFNLLRLVNMLLEIQNRSLHYSILLRAFSAFIAFPSPQYHTNFRFHHYFTTNKMCGCTASIQIHCLFMLHVILLTLIVQSKSKNNINKVYTMDSDFVQVSL